MAGGVFSSAKLNGMTIRESANDGSDFTNPDADYRRLFLGEDGQLHVKDSSGTVTDIGSGGSGDVATDAIWDAAGDLAVGTGANTAAKLAKGNAGGHLSIIDGAVAWDAGTSFPGSPDSNDRYYRTDLGLEFIFDGTQWVTANIFSMSTGFISITVNNTYPLGNFPDVFTSIKPYQLQGGFHVTTTNTGSAYWNINVGTFASGTTSFTNRMTMDTSAVSANVYNQIKTSSGAVFSLAVGSCAVQTLKTSTPGQLDGGATFYYRGVAT